MYPHREKTIRTLVFGVLLVGVACGTEHASAGEGAGIVFLVCTGVFVVLTAGFTFVFQLASEEAAARRRLKRFPPVRLSDSGDGNVRLTGRVVATGDSLRAPLSGRPCVYYEVSVRVAYRWAHVEATRGGGGSRNLGRRASATFKRRAGEAFEIDDGTGLALVTMPLRVRVEGNAPEMYVCTAIPVSHHAAWAGEMIPSVLLGLAAEAGLLSGEVAQAIEGDEGIIADGDLITVGGQLSHEIRPDRKAAHFRAPPVRAILTGEPLVMVKDGQPTPELTHAVAER